MSFAGVAAIKVDSFSLQFSDCVECNDSLD